MSLIELHNVGYHYDNKKTVLTELNYTFDAGKVHAIVGKSGAGKTTLLSLLSGLTTPTEGKILFRRRRYRRHG